jgi:hypothetical protein
MFSKTKQLLRFVFYHGIQIRNCFPLLRKKSTKCVEIINIKVLGNIKIKTPIETVDRTGKSQVVNIRGCYGVLHYKRNLGEGLNKFNIARVVKNLFTPAFNLS